MIDASEWRSAGLIQLHDLDTRVVSRERIIYYVHTRHDAVQRFYGNEGVAQEERTGDVELNRIFRYDPSKVEVRVQDPGLGETGCPDVYPRTTQCGGLVVAMDSGEDVGLPCHQNPDGGGEDDDVGDCVIVAGDVDSDAGEVLLAVVAAGGDVLADETIPDIGLVAGSYENAIGGEMRNVAIVYGRSQGINNRDAASREIGVDDEVLKRDVFEAVG